MFQSTTWELEEAGKSDSSKFDMLMPTVVKPKSTVGNPDPSFDPFVANIPLSDYPVEVGEPDHPKTDLDVTISYVER